MFGSLGSTAWVFILIFSSIIVLSCAGIGWIGYKLINKLGRYPSRTPAIQMGILFWLAAIEIASMTALVAFFKVLVSD